MNECKPWITPQRFTPSTHRQSASVWSTISPPPPTPALLQRTCAVPKRSRTASASDCTDAASLTSVSTPTTPSSAAVASSGAFSTSAMTTCMPSSTKRAAIARPMPLAPPVTTATRPSSSRTRQYRYCSALYGPPGGTPRYSACSSSSLVSLTPRASRCRRATFSSSCFGEHVDADRVAPGVVEQLDLREHLVRERARHHEARMAGRASEVHEAAFGEHDDRVAVGERPQVDLRLDREALDARDSEPSPAMSISLSKWPMLHDDRVVLHPGHVVDGDHVHVAGRGHEDVGGRRRRPRARRPGTPPSPPAAR